MRSVACRYRSWVRNLLGLALVIVPSLLASGCGKSQEGKSASGQPIEVVQPDGPNEAEKLLEQMIAAYQKAQSYADRGELRIQYRRDGRPFESKVPFSVVLQRPNKLQMNLYLAHVVCDGKNLFGWTDDLPGYILKRPTSSPLTLGEITSDDVLRSVLNEGLAGGSLQLTMLLGADAMELIRAGGERPELLADDVADGVKCRRVRIRREDGSLTYWIEADTLVLRRIEFPTERLALTMAEPTRPTNLTMTAEFTDPQLNPQISPEAFQFEPPPSVKIVDQLDPYVAIQPPPPMAQSLGTKLGDLTLTSLDGKTLARADFAGKTTVFFFWSLGSSDCLPAIAKLNEAYAKFRDRPDASFLAVSLDPGGAQGIADAELQAMLKKHKIEVPAARDLTQSALAALDVRFVPNLFIVGPDGTVQDNEIGLNPKLVEELGARIERVVKGESLVADARARYEERVRKYEQAQQATAGPGGNIPSLPQGVIAPAAEPKALKMTRLWKSTEIKQPGFVLATDAATGPTRIIVADGLRAVAELDGKGKLLRRIELDLPTSPSEAIVSFWRTAVDKQGKRLFVGSARAQQQLHVFDSDFKRLLSFPEGTHAGISDVQLADLDNDGEPEINVGYWGVVGLQNVALDGTRRWTNRRLPENVLRLAATSAAGGKRLLVCATGLMTLAVVDDAGQTVKEMPVGSRGVRTIAIADLNGDGRIEMCGIATMGPGTDTAVGFDGAGQETWNYPLPPGVYPVPEMQNEIIAAGPLLPKEPGLWVFAGADGTVHFVNAEGKPIDSFAWGEAIRGLTVGMLDGAATLFIADAKSVTALQFAR